MDTLKKSILLCLVLWVGFVACQDDDKTKSNLTENAFRKKALSVFNVVRFPNTACAGTGNQNGTCYTSSECASRNGVASGTCANSYGVCCIFTINCGGTSSQNCTYFQSATSSQPAGQCIATICEASNDICQLRIDFISFAITGPSTATQSATKALAGVAPNNANGVPITYATNCLTDKFSVTGNGGYSPSVICGKNDNFHMYVDSSASCNEFNFQLGPTGIGAAIPATRSWNLKISQIPCNSDYAAPPGCTQYFYGATSGKINSFNWAGGTQLANQEQTICFRREKGFCGICFSAAGANDFKVSGDAKGFNAEMKCCAYGDDGKKTTGFDCLQIPGAFKSAIATKVIPNSFCGVKLNAEAAGGAISATICTRQTPFQVNFISDGYTFAMIATTALNGFNLDYFETAC